MQPTRTRDHTFWWWSHVDQVEVPVGNRYNRIVINVEHFQDQRHPLMMVSCLMFAWQVVRTRGAFS